MITSRVLMGREREVALIHALINDARAGRSRVLLIRGEAGIGKTALLEYAINSAADLCVVRALGVESEAELQFSGLLELVRPLLRHVDELPVHQADALRSALGLVTARTATGDRFAVGAATLGLLAAAAERQPLLVVVDDMQWLDRASADAVLFASRRVGADRVGLLLAAREGIDAAGVETFDLPGLPRDAVEHLAAGARGDVVERLHAATGGNPLALLDALSLLDADQLAGHAPLDEPLPAGPRLERAFARRIDALPQAASRALVVVATAATPELDAIGGALAELGLDVAALSPAEHAGLIRIADAQVEIAHPLARSVVYHRAAPSERRAAHQALAAALAARSRAPERTWHLAAAAVGPDERVAAALEEEAATAIGGGGFASATLALERAARLSPTLELRVRRLYAAADAAWRAGRGDRARALLREALQDCAEPLLRADILHLEGHIEHFVGEMMTAHDLLLDAAALVEEASPTKAAAILADAVEACLYGGRVDLQLAAAARAREIAPRERGREDFLAEMCLAEALFMGGRGNDAIPLYERGLGLFGADETLRSDPLSGALAAYGLCWLERSHAACDVARRAVALARAQGSVASLPYALFGLAWAERRVGMWREAVASATEAIAIARETSQTTLVCECLIEVGVVAAARGHEDDARAALDEAAALADRHGLGYFTRLLEAPRALLELGLGRFEEAATRLERLRRSLDHAGMHMIELPLPDLVEAYVRLGRVEEAAAVAADLRADVSPYCAPALAARCRGLVVGDDDFEQHFALSLSLHPEREDPFARARTQLLFGERLRRAARRIEAREQLRRALDTFEQLGAEPWAGRARGELRASGETLRRREPHEEEELTPQELQIALQVAEGKTNKEVGAALFLSPKTIEFHLTHVYRKLGVHSRGELIRRFAVSGSG